MQPTQLAQRLQSMSGPTLERLGVVRVTCERTNRGSVRIAISIGLATIPPASLEISFLCPLRLDLIPHALKKPVKTDLSEILSERKSRTWSMSSTPSAPFFPKIAVGGSSTPVIPYQQLKLSPRVISMKTRCESSPSFPSAGQTARPFQPPCGRRPRGSSSNYRPPRYARLALSEWKQGSRRKRRANRFQIKLLTDQGKTVRCGLRMSPIP